MAGAKRIFWQHHAFGAIPKGGTGFAESQDRTFTELTGGQALFRD
jgi:hypothetical protein